MEISCLESQTDSFLESEDFFGFGDKFFVTNYLEFSEIIYGKKLVPLMPLSKIYLVHT